MKKYIYNLGYHSYEESENIQLLHEEKYSGKEFREIVNKAIINVLQKTEVRKGERVTFQSIFYYVVDELINNFNFKKLKFDAEFEVFGWADILDENDWKENRDDNLKELTKELKKKLLK